MSSNRVTPIEIGKEEFRKIGYQLVDNIAIFFDTIEQRPVTPGESPKDLAPFIGTASLPEDGMNPEEIMTRATELMFNHSLLNGHPKFHGYITSSPAPLGALADFLAAAVNPNVGANILSPMATEIEKQTIGWLAELIGVSSTYGGILVSGGNMANFTGFLAGRTAKVPKHFREDGMNNNPSQLTVYCSRATHTWIEKAVFLFGLGTKAVRWIETDHENKLDVEKLRHTIDYDLKAGGTPLMVIGNAGDVSTGTVDDLKAIATVCHDYNLWFHIDGAYGIPAAAIPQYKAMFDGIEAADSIALDPHKWLYCPLEAGCTLVKNPQHLIDTYSAHPEYYNFDSYDTAARNFYEYGFQNSRGFRALKVWTMLQHVGRAGYIEMISEDILLSKLLFTLAQHNAELEAVSNHLSITTLRFVPTDLNGGTTENETYLNKLNEALLNTLQVGGEVFLSNAIVKGKYCLRSCIVNFRTSKKDIEEIIGIIVREGRLLHQKLVTANATV